MTRRFIAQFTLAVRPAAATPVELSSLLPSMQKVRLQRPWRGLLEGNNQGCACRQQARWHGFYLTCSSGGRFAPASMPWPVGDLGATDPEVRPIKVTWGFGEGAIMLRKSNVPFVRG